MEYTCQFLTQNAKELTAGLAGAVDGRNPQVGGAAVKDDSERLRGGADGDHTIIGQLEGHERTD